MLEVLDVKSRKNYCNVMESGSQKFISSEIPFLLEALSNIVSLWLIIEAEKRLFNIDLNSPRLEPSLTLY
jgi:hypothetical protein